MKPRTPSDRAVAAIMAMHYGQEKAAGMLGVTDRSIRRYVAEAKDPTTEVSASVRYLIREAAPAEDGREINLGEWIFERMRAFSAILESKVRIADPNTAAGAQVIEIGRQHVQDLLEHAQTRTYIAALFGLTGKQEIVEYERPNPTPERLGSPDGRDEQAPGRYPTQTRAALD